MKENKNIIWAILVIIFMVILYFGIDWIFTCGLIKLLCLCFGFTFSWGTATGIWIITLFVKWSLQVMLHRIGD